MKGNLMGPLQADFQLPAPVPCLLRNISEANSSGNMQGVHNSRYKFSAIHYHCPESQSTPKDCPLLPLLCSIPHLHHLGEEEPSGHSFLCCGMRMLITHLSHIKDNRKELNSSFCRSPERPVSNVCISQWAAHPADLWNEFFKFIQKHKNLEYFL